MLGRRGRCAKQELRATLGVLVSREEGRTRWCADHSEMAGNPNNGRPSFGPTYLPWPTFGGRKLVISLLVLPQGSTRTSNNNFAPLSKPAVVGCVPHDYEKPRLAGCVRARHGWPGSQHC